MQNVCRVNVLEAPEDLIEEVLEVLVRKVLRGRYDPIEICNEGEASQATSRDLDGYDYWLVLRD